MLNYSQRNSRPRRVVQRVLALLIVASGALVASGAGASGLHVILPSQNPASNWPGGSVEAPAFLPLINEARRNQEGLGPLRLNVARYNRLSVADQLFVVTNLERVTRGETPIYGLWSVLNSAAATGAREATDPVAPADLESSFASIWSEAPPSRTQEALFADFAWMYKDGPLTPGDDFINEGCLHAGEWGCWAHRDNILEQSPGNFGSAGSLILLAGASGGVLDSRGMASLAMGFAWVEAIPSTGIVYTWAQAVRFLGLPSSYVPTTTTTTTPTTTTVPTTTTTMTTPVTSTTLGG